MRFDVFVDLLALFGKLFGASRHHILQHVFVLGKFGQDIFDGSRAQDATDQPIAFAAFVDGGQRFDDGSAWASKVGMESS